MRSSFDFSAVPLDDGAYPAIFRQNTDSLRPSPLRSERLFPRFTNTPQSSSDYFLSLFVQIPWTLVLSCRSTRIRVERGLFRFPFPGCFLDAHFRPPNWDFGGQAEKSFFCHTLLFLTLPEWLLVSRHAVPLQDLHSRHVENRTFSRGVNATFTTNISQTVGVQSHSLFTRRHARVFSTLPWLGGNGNYTLLFCRPVIPRGCAKAMSFSFFFFGFLNGALTMSALDGAWASPALPSFRFRVAFSFLPLQTSTYLTMVCGLNWPQHE